MQLVTYCFGILIFIGCVSCEELLEVSDISTQEVFLLAPTNNRVLDKKSVNFIWEEVADAESYRIQVAYPSFLEASQFSLDTLVVKDSAYTRPFVTKNLENNSYEWRVKALNSDFETTYKTQAFTVETLEN